MNNNLINALIFLIKSIYYSIISLIGLVALVIIEIHLCIFDFVGRTDMAVLALRLEEYYKNGVKLIFNKILE